MQDKNVTQDDQGNTAFKIDKISNDIRTDLSCCIMPKTYKWLYKKMQKIQTAQKPEQGKAQLAKYYLKKFTLYTVYGLYRFLHFILLQLIRVIFVAANQAPKEAFKNLLNGKISYLMHPYFASRWFKRHFKDLRLDDTSSFPSPAIFPKA